jgi:hypothetical protein
MGLRPQKLSSQSVQKPIFSSPYFQHNKFVTVDDFVLSKPPTSTNRTRFQREARNTFNINQLRTAKFHSFQ